MLIVDLWISCVLVPTDLPLSQAVSFGDLVRVVIERILVLVERSLAHS